MLARILFLVSIFLVSSCSDKNKEDGYDFDNNPTQVVDDMFAVQTQRGKVTMRLEAKRMERYENDSLSIESFPLGMKVFTYNSEGLLESTIFSDQARHETAKKQFKDEVWMAFGNVKIHNHLKDETIETDTIYWDRTLGKIYSDCYVRLYSPDGFMQGYGMESDERAKESRILTPFNSYGIVVKDTTFVLVDSANFIGPFPKK